MKNPLNNLTIVFVSGRIKKPYGYMDTSSEPIYQTGDHMSGFVTIWYGSGMNAYAAWNYNSSQAVAGGGGYAKDGVLFADILNKVFGTDISNHGEGLERAISDAEANGLTITRMWEVNSLAKAQL